MSEEKTVEERTAEVEARIAARAADVAKRRADQKLKDLEKYEELAIELGPESIGYVEVERFFEGFPVLVIVRMPSKVLMKRHGARLKMTESETPTLDLESAEAANDELGGSVVIYPDAETLKALDEKLPGIRAAAGGKAAQMRGAKVERKGKG